MKVLVVEDDVLSQIFLKKTLEAYGSCTVAENGEQGVDMFREALESGEPFDLLCLDIMMPVKDGQQALEEIRAIEKEAGIKPRDEAKVIMTTALDDPKSVVAAYYKGGATAYLAKPIERHRLVGVLQDLGLVDEAREA